MSTIRHAKRSKKCPPGPCQSTAVAIPARKRRRVLPPRLPVVSRGPTPEKDSPVDLGGIEKATVLAHVWKVRAHVISPFLPATQVDGEGVRGINDDSRSVGAKERSVVVNWMMEVCALLDLRQTSLALAVTVLDRWLAVGEVNVRGLQLVGAASMFIASKHEESVPVRVARLVNACAGAVSGAAVIRTEAAILNALGWRVQVCVPLAIVDVLATSLVHPDDRVSAVRIARFAAHLALLDAKLAAVAPPLVAAGCASIAATILTHDLHHIRAGPPAVLCLIDAIPPDGLRSVSRRILRVWTYAVASHVAGNPVHLVQEHASDTARIFSEPVAVALEKRFGVSVNGSAVFSEWAKKQDM